MRRTRVLLAAAAMALATVGCSTDAGPSRATTSAAGCPGWPSCDTSTSGAGSSTTTAVPSPTGTSVKDLYAAARTAALGAKSGRVSGELTTDGEQLEIELAGRTDGTNQTLTMSGKSLGGKMTLYTVDGKNYLVGDKAFWTKNANAEAGRQLAGKYVLMSADDAKSFSDLALGSLLQEMFADNELAPLAALTTGVQSRTEKGEKVYVLTDTASDSGTLVLSAEGRPLLRRISVGGTEPADLAFDQWDDAPVVRAPDPKKVVKL